MRVVGVGGDAFYIQTVQQSHRQLYMPINLAALCVEANECRRVTIAIQVMAMRSSGHSFTLLASKNKKQVLPV